jgi:hypothetical protein
MLLKAMLAATVVAGCVPGVIDSDRQHVTLRDDLNVTAVDVEAAGGLTPIVHVDVAPGTASLLVQARGDGAQLSLASLVAPDGRDLVAAGEVVTRSSRGAAGEVAWLYPNGAGDVAPGAWRLVVRAEDDSAAPWDGAIALEVLARAAQDPLTVCGLRLDVLVADDALHAADTDAALANMTSHANTLFAGAGITILDYGVARWDGVSSSVQLGGDQRVLLERVRGGLAQLATDGLARRGALRVLLVRSLGAGGTAGYALGLPAPFAAAGDDRTGATVLLSSEALLADGYFDVPRAATTLAHEIGHQLGLYHTTELAGQPHDPLSDTPECSDSSCPDGFADNLMTPGGDPARHVLTHQQARVMRAHPACEPTTRPIGA